MGIFIGIFRIFSKSQKLVMLGLSALFVSCAPVTYVKPIVGLNLKIAPEDRSIATQEDYIMAESLLGYGASSSGSETYDGLPVFKPVSLNPSEYCFVVNVTGTGLARAFHAKKASCDKAFPGLGAVSPVFEWNQSPQIEAAFGERRFDVLAFRKDSFGGNCPATIEGIQKTTGDEFWVDGKKMAFPEGPLAPLNVASKTIRLEAGQNDVELNVKSLGSRIIAENYGCRSFKMFPDSESGSDILKTGSTTVFFDVECPNEADVARITIGKYYPKVSEKPCDKITGRAVVVSEPIDSYDVKASEWDWYYPFVQVSVWDSKNQVKLASKSFKYKYVPSGHFETLKDATLEEWSREIVPGEDVFWLGSIDDDQIFVGVKDSNQNTFFEMPLERDKNKEGLNFPDLVWTGNGLQEIVSQDTKESFSEISSSTTLDLPLGDFYPQVTSQFALRAVQSEEQKMSAFVAKQKIILRPQFTFVGSDEFTDEDGVVSRRSVIYRSPDKGRSWFRIYVGPENSEIYDISAIGKDSLQGAQGFYAIEKIPVLNSQGQQTGQHKLRVLVQKPRTAGF